MPKLPKLQNRFSQRLPVDKVAVPYASSSAVDARPSNRIPASSITDRVFQDASMQGLSAPPLFNFRHFSSF
jgi:hypothetical protein